MTFGQKVKNRRKELGMTQVELAFTTHLSQPYISMLEKGQFNPTAPAIIKLAVVLDLPVDELLGISNTKKAG
ncbi:MAG: helix-turn-helix transcriptional regulator [Ruminococcus sp.]|nr:helix-turn-helix transcriptional regulator [Ruminococcus sp.]